MKWRILIAFAVATTACLVGAAPVAQAAPQCPRPGYIVAPGVPGVSPDDNGNGIVCVNDDGTITDDSPSPDSPSGPPYPDTDNDGFYCWNSDKNVVTDNPPPSQTPADLTCMPGFVIMPIAIYPPPLP